MDQKQLGKAPAASFFAIFAPLLSPQINKPYGNQQ
jgi:hypothetical protein